MTQYKAMTAYLKWEDMGIVVIPNMKKKGSMKESSMLADVEVLGESLR